MAFDQFHQDPAYVAASAIIPAAMRQAGVVTWEAYCLANDARATRHLDHGRAQALMQRRAQRHPAPFLDDAGHLCLRVPLDSLGMRFAIVWASDWVMLQEGGWNGLWTFNRIKDGKGGAVKSWRPMSRREKANTQTAARIILDLGDSTKAWFINGDRLDLRRPNLTTRGAKKLTPARRLAREGIAEARAMASR